MTVKVYLYQVSQSHTPIPHHILKSESVNHAFVHRDCTYKAFQYPAKAGLKAVFMS